MLISQNDHSGLVSVWQYPPSIALLCLAKACSVAPLWTYVVSGACFPGLVLCILFALRYYALIKAMLPL